MPQVTQIRKNKYTPKWDLTPEINYNLSQRDLVIEEPETNTQESTPIIPELKVPKLQGDNHIYAEPALLHGFRDYSADIISPEYEDTDYLEYDAEDNHILFVISKKDTNIEDCKCCDHSKIHWLSCMTDVPEMAAEHYAICPDCNSAIILIGDWNCQLLDNTHEHNWEYTEDGRYCTLCQTTEDPTSVSYEVVDNNHHRKVLEFSDYTHKLDIEECLFEKQDAPSAEVIIQCKTCKQYISQDPSIRVTYKSVSDTQHEMFRTFDNGVVISYGTENHGILDDEPTYEQDTETNNKHYKVSTGQCSLCAYVSPGTRTLESCQFDSETSTCRHCGRVCTEHVYQNINNNMKECTICGHTIEPRYTYEYIDPQVHNSYRVYEDGTKELIEQANHHYTDGICDSCRYEHGTLGYDPHSWVTTYSDITDTTHTKTQRCSVCNKVVIEEAVTHNFDNDSITYNADKTKEIKTCVECGHKVESDHVHNLSRVYSKSINSITCQYTDTCTECGYSVRSSHDTHDWIANEDDTKHCSYCLGICDHSNKLSDSYKYSGVETEDTNHLHIVTCKACGYTDDTLEEHTWQTSYTMGDTSSSYHRHSRSIQCTKCSKIQQINGANYVTEHHSYDLTSIEDKSNVSTISCACNGTFTDLTLMCPTLVNDSHIWSRAMVTTGSIYEQQKYLNGTYIKGFNPEWGLEFTNNQDSCSMFIMGGSVDSTTRLKYRELSNVRKCSHSKVDISKCIVHNNAVWTSAPADAICPDCGALIILTNSEDDCTHGLQFTTTETASEETTN